MPGKRVTKAEKDKRIALVSEWIISGNSDTKVIKMAKEEWGLSRRQAIRYFNDAYKPWKEQRATTLEQRRLAKIEKLQNDLQNLDEKYRKTPQGINAIARMEKLIIRLDALEPPRQHRHSGELNHTHQILNIDPLEDYDQADNSTEENIGA